MMTFEHIILGQMLLGRKFPQLQPHHFQEKADLAIFKILSAGITVAPEIVTRVNEELGMVAIDENTLFAMTQGSSQDGDQTAELLIRAYEKRQLAEIIQEASRDLISTREPQEIIAELQSKLQKVGTDSISAIHKLDQVVLESIQYKLEKLEQDTFQSGIEDLDTLIGSLRSGWLVTIAGYSGGGKTTLALQMYANLWKNQSKAGLLFSLEMPKTQIADRIVSLIWDVPYRLVRNYGKDSAMKDLDRLGYQDRLTTAFNQIQNTNLFLSEYSTIDEIEAKTRQFASKTKLDFIVIDYIQLLRTPTKQPRYIELGLISSRLKVLAKQLDCLVIVLAQLNKDGDIRESQNITNDSDMILKVERNKEKNFTKITLAKDRDEGKFGSTDLGFDDELKKFIPLKL